MTIEIDRAGLAARDTWETARAWLDEHGRVALASVVAAWGSAPVPPGGQLVVAPGDRFEGSVSGGCVEVDVLLEASEAMSAGKPRLVEYGISDDVAWRAGLACGGSVKILVEPLTSADIPWLDAIIEARRARRSIVGVTDISEGARRVYGEGEVPEWLAPTLAGGGVGLADSPDGQAFVRTLVPPLRVIIAGATHIGQVLAQMARLAGYGVTVVDPRPVFASEERFGMAAALGTWPMSSFAELGLDARTAVVAVAHASHIDDEALTAALRSPCLYIGALGSRATHAKRMERLKAAGFSEEELQRIRGPVGLAIGAKGPAEIAVSILAEIIKVLRHG